MAHHVGRARAAYVLKQLTARAQELGVAAQAPPYSAYQNSIPLEEQAAHPGDVGLEADYVALGTDGFGRSDTRASLRSFFEVDRYHIAVASLNVLTWSGDVSPEIVAGAIKRYVIDSTGCAPWKK
jgi:pyruvate dehydrogenase complex dehydrogenase (E1) component